MPYPAGHRSAVKKNIIDSARMLFNRHGFDNVSIHQIMAGAGLTHGGFYSYFKCKSDLYAEVLTCFFTDPNWKSCWEGVNVDLSSSDVERSLIQNGRPRSTAAQGIASLCIGGMVVARALVDRALADELRDACMTVALDLGGWHKQSKSKNGKSKA